MTLNFFVLPDDAATLTISAKPIPEFTVKTSYSDLLLSLNMFEKTNFEPTHEVFNTVSTFLYSQGAELINKGNITADQLILAKKYQIAIARLPEVTQYISKSGGYHKNQLQAAAIFYIALSQMDTVLSDN